MMRLECECGTVFEGLPREAFLEGWDVFLYEDVITCGNCPSAPKLIEHIKNVETRDPRPGSQDSREGQEF